MSAGKRKHLPVSVRQRLRNLRDKTGEDYQFLLTTYRKASRFRRSVRTRCTKASEYV